MYQKGLKAQLKEKFNIKITITTMPSLKNDSGSSGTKFPGNINTTLINLMLMTQSLGIEIYTILNFSYYLLLISILLDNYRATNLVNSKNLLKPKLFIKVAINKYIKTRLSSLLILE